MIGHSYIMEIDFKIGAKTMKKITYNPLWKTLIDKGIKKKTELITLAGISSGTLAKMSKDQEVSMTVLVKICSALNVELSDVAEITEE